MSVALGKKQDLFKFPQDRDLPVKKDLIDRQPESETPSNQMDLKMPHNLTHLLDRSTVSQVTLWKSFQKTLC